MASTWPPIRGTAFNLAFSLYKSDGTIIANPGTYTKKISKDFGALADVDTAVTEVDTTYGFLKLPLTATEMTADVVYVQVKDDTAGCIPFTATIYTAAQSLDTVDTNVDAILADTGTDGVVVASGSKTGYSIASGGIAASAFAAGAIDAAAIAADAIGASELAADAATEIGTAVWATAARTLTANSNLNDPSAATIADAVWDEAIAGHAGVGSTGAALSAAGGSGDPWATALPGAYGAGTAGKIIGDNVNAKVGDVKAKTDNLPASPAATGAAMTLTAAYDAAKTAAAAGAKMDIVDAPNATALGAIADKILGRAIAGGADTGRTVRQALRRLRNKVSLSAGTMTVTAEDDSTPDWTAAVTTDAAAEPITSVDPS